MLLKSKYIEHIVRTCANTDEYLETTLVEMYAEYGHVSLSCGNFYQFNAKSRRPAFWYAIIGWYGRNDVYESTFENFDDMLVEKVQPNNATFVVDLSACIHSDYMETGLDVSRVIKGYEL